MPVLTPMLVSTPKPVPIRDWDRPASTGSNASALVYGVGMPRNIEIKARARDLGRVRALALAHADGPPAVLVQTDSFFRVPAGRLKLRCMEGTAGGQLIRYDRPDQAGPKQSDYTLTQVEDAQACLREHTARYGLRGVVRKQRELIWIGQTRVHLDQVDGLGTFVELEVVLGEAQTAAEGRTIAADIMDRLGIRDQDLIEQAYIDLLEAGSTTGPEV